MANAGLKLAIRGDRPAGVIRAYFSTLDDSERVEIGRLSIAVADRLPAAFEAWKRGMTEVVGLMTEDAVGVRPTGFEEFRPGDKN